MVADRVVPHGQREHPVEHQAAAARAATVEAEHELVHVAGQVVLLDRALMSAQEPPLGKRGDPVHGGQKFAGILPAGARGLGLGDLAASLVGADVPIDTENGGQVRVGLVQAGHMGGGHRGQELFGPTGSSEGGDLAADGS